MAYDEGTAQRIREALAERDDVVEKKMFGGVCFMVSGHMAVGIANEDLMVRVGKEHHDACSALPHAGPMDFTGRPMKGFLFVGEAGYAEDDDLAAWVQRGVDHATSLPPK